MLDVTWQQLFNFNFNRGITVYGPFVRLTVQYCGDRSRSHFAYSDC